jgi:hypothetical protein
LDTHVAFLLNIDEGGEIDFVLSLCGRGGKGLAKLTVVLERGGGTEGDVYC